MWQAALGSKGTRLTTYQGLTKPLPDALSSDSGKRTTETRPRAQALLSVTLTTSASMLEGQAWVLACISFPGARSAMVR
jgi:hypothetical protein